MKGKLFLVFMSLLLVTGLVFAACAKATPKPTPAPAAGAPAATPAPAPVATPRPAPAATPAPTAMKWKMASAWPKGTVLQEAADRFAKIVGEMSGGRLTIDSHPGGAIVGALEIFDAVNAGTIDVSSGWAGYWIGKEPAGPLFAALPMGFDVYSFLAWTYSGGGLDLWKEMYSKYNFGFVGPGGILPPEDFAWAHKPLRTLDDFKGLKFRTVGFWGEILQRLGASVVTLPGAEVYPSLQRKVLDAAEYSNPNIDYDLGFHEIAKYLHVPGLHQPSSILEIIVNKKSWDALTPDLQSIVRTSAESTTLWLLQASIWRDSIALEKFKAYGTEIIYVDPKIQAEIKRLADALYDEKAAKDPFFAKVLKSQRDFRAKYDAYSKLMTPQLP